MEQVEYLEEYVEEYPNVIPQILNNTDIEEFLPVNEDDSFDLLPVNTNFDEFIEEDPLVKRYRNDFQRNSHAKKNEEMTTFNDQKGTFRHIESADSSTHKESYKNLITYNNQSSNRTESAAKVISCKTIDTSAIRNRSFPFNTIPLTTSIHATRKPNLIQVTKTTKFSGQRRPKSLFGSYTKLNLNRSIDSSLNRIIAVKKSGNNLIGKLKQPVLHSTANIFGSFNEKIIKYKQENPGLFPVKEPEIPKPAKKITAKSSLQSVFINKSNRSLSFKEKKCPMFKPNLNVKKFSRYASKSMSSLIMSSELLDKDNSSIIDDEIDGSVVVEEEIVKTNNEIQNDDSDKDSFDGLVETLNEYIDDETNNDQIAENLDSIDKCDLNIIQPQQTIKLDIQPNIIDQGTHYIKLDESPILRKQIKNYGRNINPLHNESSYESIKTKTVLSNEKPETLRNKNEKMDQDSNRNNYPEQTKPIVKDTKVKIQRKKSETFVNKKVQEAKKDNELVNNKPIIISDIKLPVKSNISGRKNILNLSQSKTEKSSDSKLQKAEKINKNIRETIQGIVNSSVDEKQTTEESCQIEEELNVSKKIESIKLSFPQKENIVAEIEKNPESTIEYCSENVEEISLISKEIHSSNKPEVKNDELQTQTLLTKIVIENKKVEDKIEDSKIDKCTEVEGIRSEEESSIANGVEKDKLSEIVDIIIKDDNKNVEIDKSTSSDSIQSPECEIEESVLLNSENLKESNKISEMKEPPLKILNDNTSLEMTIMDSIDNEQKGDNLDDVDEIDNILAEIDSVMESIHSDENKPKEAEILNRPLSVTNLTILEPETVLKKIDTVTMASTLTEDKNIEDKDKKSGIEKQDNFPQISLESNGVFSEGSPQSKNDYLNITNNSQKELNESLLPEETKTLSKADDPCREFSKTRKTSKDSSKSIDLNNQISNTDESDKEPVKVDGLGKEVSKVRKISKDSFKSINSNKEISTAEDKDKESFKSNDFVKDSSKVVKISKDSLKPNDSDKESSNTDGFVNMDNPGKEISKIKKINNDSLKSNDSNKEISKAEDKEAESFKPNDLVKDSSKVFKISNDSLKSNDSDKELSNTNDLGKEISKMKIINDSLKSNNANTDSFKADDCSKESLKPNDRIKEAPQTIESSDELSKIEASCKENPLEKLTLDNSKRSAKTADPVKVTSKSEKNEKSTNTNKEMRAKFDSITKIAKVVLLKTDKIPVFKKQNFKSTQQCVKVQQESKNSSKTRNIQNLSVRTRKQSKDQSDMEKNKSTNETKIESEVTTRSRHKNNVKESKIKDTAKKETKTENETTNTNSEVIRLNFRSGKSIRQTKKPPIENKPEEKTNKVNVDKKLLIENKPEVKTNKVNADKKQSTENNIEEKNKVTVDILENLNNKSVEIPKNAEISVKNKAIIQTDSSNVAEPENNKDILEKKLDNLSISTKTMEIVNTTIEILKNKDIAENTLEGFENLSECEKTKKINLENCTISSENENNSENTLKSEQTKQTVTEKNEELTKNSENFDKAILDNEHFQDNLNKKCETLNMKKTRISTSTEVKEKISDGLSDYEVESIMAKKVEFNKKDDALMPTCKGTRLARKRLLESSNSESTESDKTDIDTTSIKSPSMEIYLKRKKMDLKLNLMTRSKKEIDLIKDKTLEQSVSHLENITDKSDSEKDNTNQTHLTNKEQEIQKENLETNKIENEFQENLTELPNAEIEQKIEKKVNKKIGNTEVKVYQTRDKNKRSMRSKANEVSKMLVKTPIRQSRSLRNKIIQYEIKDNNKTKNSDNKNNSKNDGEQNKNTSISSPQPTNILSDFAYPEIFSSTPNEQSSQISSKRLRRPYNNVNMLATDLNDSMLIPKSEKRRERKTASLTAKSENPTQNITRDAKDMMAPTRTCARIIRRRQSNLIQISRKEYEKVLRDNIFKKEKQNQTKSKNLLKTHGITKSLKVKLQRLSVNTIKKLMEPNVKEQKGQNEIILKQPNLKEQTRPSEIILKQLNVNELTEQNETILKQSNEKEAIQKEHSETILKQIESPKSTNEEKMVTRKDSTQKSLDEIKETKETVENNAKEKRKVKGKKSDESKNNSQELETSITIDNNKSDKQSEDLSNISSHGPAESTPKENQELKPQQENKQPTSLEKPKKGLISVVPLNDRVSRRDTIRKSEEYSKRMTRARSMPRNLANIEKELFNPSIISKNNSLSIALLNKEYENDSAENKGHNIRNKTPTPATENYDNADKNGHNLRNKTPTPTLTTTNENYNNQVILKDFSGPVSDHFSSNQNLRLRNRISRGGHKIQSDEKTIESIIMAHIISRENSKESSNSPQNNRNRAKNKNGSQLSGNKIENNTKYDKQIEEINKYPQQSVGQSGPVSLQTLEKNWLSTNEKKLIEGEIELQQENSKEKILASSSTKPDSVFVSTIVPLDQLKSTKPNVPTLNQLLPANQQLKQNQTLVKTAIIQPPAQVKLLPAHIVVETVFMTREEYDRKNLKKIIAPPVPLSLTAQMKQKAQTKLTASVDSSISTCPTIPRSNTQNVAHFRDVESIMNKISDLLELQIKSESRLNLNESEEQRRKIQRFNNISKMKLSSENALQVLIFLQNYFFNVTTPETYAKQQARQHQFLNTTVTSSPSPSEPMSSSSSTSSSRQELLNLANDSEKCFSFKRIRLQKQPEQQDNQQNLTQFQKQQKSAQNSKGLNKRPAGTLLSDIQSPSKMLRSSEKPSNSTNLNSQLNFPITGAITEKEPEEILPDFLNILSPQIKEELPDETISI